jgi:hypothetical protein
MEPSELLRFAVEVLERLGIRYFVTGSTVTIFYGEPRFTNDIDIVADLSIESVVEFCRQFPDEEFYVSPEAATSAVQRCAMFNIIQPRSGLKIDMIVAAASTFNQSRFTRARRVQVGDDWTASFASPEDAIIKKLEFYQQGGSDKHLRDIVGVLRTGGEAIDLEYIDRWANELGVAEIWRLVLDRLQRP